MIAIAPMHEMLAEVWLCDDRVVSLCEIEQNLFLLRNIVSLWQIQRKDDK